MNGIWRTDTDAAYTEELRQVREGTDKRRRLDDAHGAAAEHDRRVEELRLRLTAEKQREASVDRLTEALERAEREAVQAHAALQEARAAMPADPRIERQAGAAARRIEASWVRTQLDIIQPQIQQYRAALPLLEAEAAGLRSRLHALGE